MKLKAGIKQATQGLGSGILQPANCNLESFKAWQAYNRWCSTGQVQGEKINICNSLLKFAVVKVCGQLIFLPTPT